MPFFVGAYPLLAPDWALDEIIRFYASLTDATISGLELPSAQVAALRDRPDLVRLLPEHWTYDIAMLPTTVAALAARPEYGLASPDADGRRAAVADVRSAQRLVGAVAGLTVRSIILPTAPGRGAIEAAHPDDLVASLVELSETGDSGVPLLIEHCDAAVPEHPPEKGFLDLDSELAAIRSMATRGTEIGLVVNWARSVIESRDPATPIRHIEAARAAGCLRRIVFSGVIPRQSAWGPAWADRHPPMNAPAPAGLADSSESLLTDEAIGTARAAAGPDVEVGVKISVRPPSATAHARRAALALIMTRLGRTDVA